MSCAVDTCTKKAVCRGWCQAHYDRWRRTGDASTPTRNIRGLLPRLTASIVVRDGHWLWTGQLSRGGYGQVSATDETGRRRTRMAHRVVYELVVGPVDESLQLDHLCRVRACCNPAHLEPVTAQENSRRGAGPGGALWDGSLPAQCQPSTRCKYGHERTDASTYVAPSGVRHCRLCANRRSREYQARQRSNADRIERLGSSF